MSLILISTLVVGLVGLVLGLALVTAGKKFYVEVDERIPQVRDCLRGSNCGACGYAGCDAVAEAIVKGEAHADACPGNSSENIAKIAAIMNIESVDQDPQVAYVQCAGTCNATKAKANYVGIHDCRAAALSGLPFMSCEYGCLGLGSCVKICPQGAITARPYADFAPMGGTCIPMRSADSIMWTVQFRNGSVKRFKFPIRTTPEGSIKPFEGKPEGANLDDELLFTEEKLATPIEVLGKKFEVTEADKVFTAMEQGR